MRQCKWFAAGYCHRGAQCWFAHTHEGDNLRQNGSTSSSSGTPLRTAPGLSAMAPVFSPSAPTIASGSDSIDYGENNADASGSNILVSSGAGRAHSVAEAEAKALEGLHEMPACGICLEKPVTYGLLGKCASLIL